MAENELLEEAKSKIFDLGVDMADRSFDGSFYCKSCKTHFPGLGDISRCLVHHASRCTFRRLAELTIELAKRANNGQEET